MSGGTLLEVRGLRTEYPVFSGPLRRVVGRVRAVDGVDLDVAAAESVALVGESGSGKTTLARSVLRLVEPSAGSVRFHGEDLLQLAARELRRTTLPQLSATTRISLRFLDAMERDAYTDLPGATFVRGYLKMVVRTLEAIVPGPEVDEFIEGYMSRFFRARG